MSNSCNTKSFFNRELHSDDLVYALTNAYYDTLDAAAADGKDFDTVDYYNTLVSELKSEDTPFMVEYHSEYSDSQKKLFKQSLVQISQDIIALLPKDFSSKVNIPTLKSLLDENLQRDLGAGRLKIEKDQEDTFEINPSQEVQEPKEVQFNKFIENTYQNCFGAVKQLKNQFSRDIFQYTLCNIDSGFFVTTNADLNNSIALYKNKLLNTITSFLRTINPNSSYPSQIYTPDGGLHRGYYYALQDMQAYLDSQNLQELVNDEYSKKLFTGNSQIMDAIHAYTTLKYFDSLLSETLGKTIKYNTLYKNCEVSINVTKYQFSKDTEHQRKSWTDSENRTAIQNSSRFSKFILDSIPLKVDGKDSGRNIGIGQLSMTISKLFSKQQELFDSTTQGAQELLAYLQAFHSSPILYSYKIFNLISSSPLIQGELRTKVGFNSTDLDIIQSLYEYVYSYDSDMHLKSYDKYKNKSIRSMEYNRLKTSYNLGKYSILSDISGVIDDCMDATYFYSEYGQEGGLKVERRVKYKDRRGSEKYKGHVNNQNSSRSQQFRESLKKTCQVVFDVPTSTSNATVTIPINIDGTDTQVKLKVTSQGTLGILEQVETIKVMPFEKNDPLVRRMYDLFGEDSPIDLSLPQQRDRLLASNQELTADEQLFKQILKFIDDRLLTGFLTHDGLQKLNIFKTLSLDEGKNYFDDLLLYSIKAQIVSDIFYKFDSRRLDPNDSYIKNKKDFIKFLRSSYEAFSNLTPEEMKTYFITNNGISRLRTIPSNTTWCDTYAQAILILQGDAAASTSKNQEDNNDANYVTAFLGGQIYNVAYKARQEAKKRQQRIDAGEDVPQTAASALLFTKHLGAIKQCVINSDIKNRAGTVKSIRDLKTSELYYNAIIHNFWASFLATGEYCIQPTTYADKVKLIQYMIDGKKYKHFNKKSLSQLSPEEIIELYRTTIGQAAKNALDNVIYTYSKLWGQKLTIDQINARLKTYTEDRLTREAFKAGVALQPDFHYRVKKINGKEALLVNETLEQQASYVDYETLRNKLEIEKINFVNDLVNSGVFFYIDYHDTSLYNSNYKSLSLREQLFKSASPVANIITSLYTTDAEVQQYADKWIHNGKLIFAYDKDGKEVLFDNTESVSELNPILEKYFYIDSLVSNNLRFQLTGFESNHPDKSKFVKMWDNIAKSLGIQNELLSSTKNIGRLQDAKIIWGHSSIGKTTYLTAYPESIIEWDNEFNPIRNKFIADTLNDSSQEAKQKFLEEAQNYLSGIGIYNPELVPAYEQYKKLITEHWQAAKAKAITEGKKLFASPTILPILFKEDFDLFLTTDEETFLSRKPNALSYKQSIDRVLSDSDIIDKTINIGGLHMSDVMALNDSYDLSLLRKSSNPEARHLAESIINIIINVSQGTQLKRNVIIPGTMHYMHNDMLEGVSKKIKAAFIHDMPAKVFNFSGDSDKIDSMDGSALTTAEQSILENRSLGSQEVGGDKKPLWYHYNQDSGTSGLMKFAAFEINNERMLMSLGSKVPLIRMYKKMTNLQWSYINEAGERVWRTSSPVTLGRSTKLTGVNRTQQNLLFTSDILQDRALYYRTYTPDGEVAYKQIVGFGGDPDNGYYTIESYVDEEGDANLLLPQQEKVYHFFDSKSNHHSTRMEGDHTINSIYELWLALGGMYSQSLGKSGVMEGSESSHHAVVEFMNKTIVPKSGEGTDRFDISQNSYDQPIKPMMIGYLTNNSGMKNGAINRNSVDRWFDDEELTYGELDSDGLGVQMDADHDVSEAATMTEFSQVISALEAGGYLHKYSKQVYNDLGRVASLASKIEIDTVTKFLAGKEDNFDEVKSELYDILGRTLLNGIKTREDQANLTDDILRAIEKRFNKNINHMADIFKIPLSDSNIYSQILPTLVSIINKKSIKRKFSGSGCVMIPGFNVAQYFKLNGTEYTFNDLVAEAIEYKKSVGTFTAPTGNTVEWERALVSEYLNVQQLNQPLSDTPGEYIPTDIIDALDSNGNEVLSGLDLDDLNSYYAFKDIPKAQEAIRTGENQDIVQRVCKTLKITPEQLINIVKYRNNVRLARNLAPVRITFERADTGQKMNVFDLAPYRRAYQSKGAAPDREAVQQAFRDLDAGVIYEESDVNREHPIKIKNLQNMPAEMIISNMYSNQFGTGNKTVAQIRKEGVNAFKIEYESPRESSQYDLIFSKAGEDNTYITFQSPKGSTSNSYMEYKESNLLPEKDKRGNINVWLISDDNRKLFKVGRYVLTNYSYKNGSFYDEDNKTVNPKNLRAEGSKVYEYIEFVSQYKVVEKYNDGDNINHIESFNKYYINIYNIKRAFKEEEDSTVNKQEFKDFVTGILNDIYAAQQYIGIEVNPTLTSGAAGNIVKYVTNMESIDWDFKRTVLIPLENVLRSKLAEKTDTISIGNELRANYEEFYNILANQRYSSWEQSLYFTAARIPAQTLQSFMQMRAVAYSGNSLNKVYVSHWQAWLQGSDYDIDKAYIMGQEFGDNGKLIKFSNLFDYSTPETLRASTWLPTPRQLYITNDQTAAGLDISYQLEKIQNLPDRASQLRQIADLIVDIYDYYDKYGQDNKINLRYDHRYYNIGQQVINDLITHERTVISANLEEAAYKNSISANIKNIVQDLKNMDLAYSPIAMKDLQDMAAESEKGALVANMSLMNPLTKYNMQVQNMVGKKVIGIAAVGEKVFFNLSYYFNEGVRSGDEKWQNNMQFAKTFNRIQNRYNFNKSRGELSQITKTCLANVNFEGFDEIRKKFVTAAQIDSQLRKELGITQQDIDSKNQKWMDYSSRLTSLVGEIESNLLSHDFIQEHKRINNASPVDLLISQILSAATDNAKELILAKINCGDNLAKCHLYLIMLGFDIKDVVAFMTTPCVSLINDLSEANMMDSYISELSIKNAIDLATGIVDPSKFLFGSVSTVDEYGNRGTISRVDDVFGKLTSGKLYSTLLALEKKNNPEFQKFNFKTYIQSYIKARLNGENLKPISSYGIISDYESKKGFYRMSDYIEKIIKQIQKARSRYAQRYINQGLSTEEAISLASNDFQLDLEEFKNVLELANETSTLGGTFLGLNQGLPSSKEDLQGSMRKIAKAVSDRELLFGISREQFLIQENATQKIIDSKAKQYKDLQEKILENNPFVKNIDHTIKLAFAFGLLGRFNTEAWLSDKALTQEDIIDSSFLGQALTAEELLSEPISYRELAADYYNLIKGTWNIFDIMNRIPQYRSILNLYNTIYIFDRESSIKSNLANKIYDEVLRRTNYIDDKQSKTITSYINDLLIASFFREQNLQFPIYRNMEYLDTNYKSKVAQTNRKIDLNTAPGRASFKMVFESIISQLQEHGRYGDVTIPNFKENAFLQGLRINYDKYEVPRLALELDMMKIGATPRSQVLFQQYLNGLNNLRNVTIGGRSLIDWFAVYNLFVNQNQYGSDRLTTVFKNSIINKDSILEEYFQYIGKLDYNQVTDNVLKDLEFNMEDLLIRMAPYVPRSEESRVTHPYIRTKNSSGEYIVKKYNPFKRTYYQISTFPSKDLLDTTDATVSEEQKYNYQCYQMLPMKNQDFNISLREGLMSSDINVLLDTLVTYSRKGLLKIFKENC